jgi:hypothetical protein
LDSWFKSYGVLKFSTEAEVWTCSQPLPMQQKLSNTIKICQNLLKNKNFKIPLKIEVSIFSKNKILYIEEAPKYMLIVQIFITRISHMPFLLSTKNDLCM